MGAIVLFDGECGLCSEAVRFILSRDRQERFSFAAQQGPVGRELLERHGATTATGATLVVIDDGRVLLRSDAVLHVLRSLGRHWRLLTVLAQVVPPPLRDRAYDAIARRRHALTCRRGHCRLPAPEHAGRFLDG